MLSAADLATPDLGSGVHFSRLPRTSWFTVIVNEDALADFAAQRTRFGDPSSMRLVATFAATGALKGYGLEVYRPMPAGGRPFVSELVNLRELLALLHACGIYGRDILPATSTCFEHRAAVWARVAHHCDCIEVSAAA